MLPLYRALKQAEAGDVTFLVYHDNHSFGQVRERLAEDVQSWVRHVTGTFSEDAVLMAHDEMDRVEANKALARRWFEKVINQRALDAVGYVYHVPEGREL